MNLPQAYFFTIAFLYYFGLAPFRFSKDGTQIVTRFVDYFAGFVDIFMIVIASLLGACLRVLVEILVDIDVPYGFSKIISLTQRVQVWISAFTYVVLLISSVVKKRAHMKLFDSLMSLDNDMEKFFNYYDTYKKLRNFNYVLVGLITFTVMFSTSVVIYLTYMRNNYLHPYMITIYVASQCYPLFNTFHYCAMCKIIIHRLKTVENLVKSNLTLQQFSNLTNINSRLKQAVYNLNGALGLGQFLNIMNNNIIITMQIYILLRMVISKDGDTYLHWNIGSSWWIAVFIFQNAFTAKVGNDLKLQVLKTNKMFLGNPIQRYRAKEVEILSGCCFYQLYGSKVECTAGGFFVIDHSLNMLMLSTIASYIIILIQFQQDTEDVY